MYILFSLSLFPPVSYVKRELLYLHYIHSYEHIRKIAPLTCCDSKFHQNKWMLWGYSRVYYGLTLIFLKVSISTDFLSTEEPSELRKLM